MHNLFRTTLFHFLHLKFVSLVSIIIISNWCNSVHASTDTCTNTVTHPLPRCTLRAAASCLGHITSLYLFHICPYLTLLLKGIFCCCFFFSFLPWHILWNKCLLLLKFLVSCSCVDSSLSLTVKIRQLRFGKYTTDEPATSIVSASWQVSKNTSMLYTRDGTLCDNLTHHEDIVTMWSQITMCLILLL